MKKIVSLLLTLMLCTTLAITAYASGAEEYFLFDEADILTDNEENIIQEQLSKISEKYQAQIIVATMDTLDGGDIDTYLEFAYDTLELGYGENHDGVLLLICMDTREWRILSNGFAGEAIDSDAIDKMGEAFVSDLSNGYYANAFKSYADECEYYLNGYLNGFPFEAGKALLISFGVGILISLVITNGWKSQLKSVQMHSKANAYVKNGSMQITQSGDYFMYRNLVMTERSEEKRSSSRSSGGSSRSTGGGSF